MATIMKNSACIINYLKHYFMKSKPKNEIVLIFKNIFQVFLVQMRTSKIFETLVLYFKMFNER